MGFRVNIDFRIEIVNGVSFLAPNEFDDQYQLLCRKRQPTKLVIRRENPNKLPPFNWRIETGDKWTSSHER